MAKQIINIGHSANDKSGDPLRTAFSKINENFTEVYNSLTLEQASRSSLIDGEAEFVLTGGANPYVTFPAVGTDQLHIQGTEIAADSGSIALTSIDGSIFLTTHGDLAPSLGWEFDRSGTLTTPLGLPRTFTAILDDDHRLDPGSPLVGDAWEFIVQFQVNPNGTVETMIDNMLVHFSNPGYANLDSFRFTETDHGIPGFNFDIGLIDLTQNPAGWTVNLQVTPPPEYPATIQSLGAVKITAVADSWVFTTNGDLQLPAGGDIVDSNGQSVLGGGGGGSTGTVTFVDNVIQGDSSYVLGLSPHSTFTDGTWSAAPGPELGPQYLRVRGGDNYEHIHFDTSNNSAFDLYVGDDYKYFKLSKDGPAVIGTSGNVNHTWTFGTDGTTIPPSLTTVRGDTANGSITGYTLRIGDGTQEAVITTPDGTESYNSSQRLVINPGKGADGTYGEGGDIYLWAGRGGDAGGTGGDIKIRGGQGMVNGDGGYIRIEPGDSQGTGAGGYLAMYGGQTAGGTGGYVDIRGGYNSGGTGGYVQLIGGGGALDGANTEIKGGDGGSGLGGNVNLYGGQSGQGLPGYGNINIFAGASSWTFDKDGVFTVQGIIHGKNNSSPVIIDAGTTGDSYISIPSFQDGGEKLTIKNIYGISTGIDLITTGGTWTFGADSHLTLPHNGDFAHVKAGSNKSINIQTTGTVARVQVTPADGVKIYTNDDAHLWQFTNGGALYLGNDAGAIYANQTSGAVTIADYLGSGGEPSMPSSRIIVGGTDAFKISRGNGTNNPSWTFDDNGSLTVPGAITKTSGNLDITAENYVKIDSTNGGQIDIGANQADGTTNSGTIMVGHAGNTLHITSGKLRISATTPPTHSTGAVGDVAGLVAFDSNYFYYCTAAYGVTGHQVTVATLYNGATAANTNSFQLTRSADTLQITVGDTISDGDGGATSTVVSVSSDSNYTYVGTGGMAYNAVFPLTFTSTSPAYVPGGNIWKRVAWSSDTW